jgi:hypothetical protein
MALAQGQRLSGLNEPAGAVGVFLEIHVSSLTPTPSARAVTDLSQISLQDQSA